MRRGRLRSPGIRGRGRRRGSVEGSCSRRSIAAAHPWASDREVCVWDHDHLSVPRCVSAPVNDAVPTIRDSQPPPRCRTSMTNWQSWRRASAVHTAQRSTSMAPRCPTSETSASAGLAKELEIPLLETDRSRLTAAEHARRRWTWPASGAVGREREPVEGEAASTGLTAGPHRPGHPEHRTSLRVAPEPPPALDAEAVGRDTPPRDPTDR